MAASNYQVLPVLGYLNQPPTFVPDPREVAGIVTPNVQDLIREELVKRKDIRVANGAVLNSPYYDLEKKVVWGATAMMLSELSAILMEEFAIA